MLYYKPRLLHTQQHLINYTQDGFFGQSSTEHIYYVATSRKCFDKTTETISKLVSQSRKKRINHWPLAFLER